MKDKILSRARTVTDARTAAVLADRLRRGLLLRLADREQSLTELAAAAGIGLQRLHYHVTALCALGLVVVTGEQPRRGRPIKRYRAVADAFFVPAAVASVRPAEALAAELGDALARERERQEQGMLYYVGEDGHPRMRTLSKSAVKRPAAAEHWRVLHLSTADALQLAREIEERLAVYAGRQRAGAVAHLVHFAMAPRMRQTRRTGWGGSRRA